jgi:hypothetical protein
MGATEPRPEGYIKDSQIERRMRRVFLVKGKTRQRLGGGRKKRVFRSLKFHGGCNEGPRRCRELRGIR